MFSYCLHRVISLQHPGTNDLSCWSAIKQQLTEHIPLIGGRSCIRLACSGCGRSPHSAPSQCRAGKIPETAGSWQDSAHSVHRKPLHKRVRRLPQNTCQWCAHSAWRFWWGNEINFWMFLFPAYSVSSCCRLEFHLLTTFSIATKQCKIGL